MGGRNARALTAERESIMAVDRRISAARLSLIALVGAYVVLALAGCGAAQAPTSSTESTNSSSTGSVSPAKKAAYAKLLSIDDVKRLTKVSDVTTASPGKRADDWPYYALYTSATKPEFLSFRAGKPEAFDDQRTLLVGKETTLTVGGHEAISWSSAEFDNGIAVRMPDTTYVVSSRWLFASPEGAQQLTIDQLKQIAELVVSRTK
jgi:hypothetical protein